MALEVPIHRCEYQENALLRYYYLRNEMTES